jgi:hypothetical protein
LGVLPSVIVAKLLISCESRSPIVGKRERKGKMSEKTINQQHNQEESRILLHPHFPEKAERRIIPLIRVLKIPEMCWVVEVTDLFNKKGQAVAECKVFKGDYGLFFVTRYGDYGHLELCRILKKMGIKGKYLMWLEAVDRNLEKEEEELRGLSDILFGCRETDDNPDDWTIHLRLEEEGDVKEYIL